MSKLPPPPAPIEPPSKAQILERIESLRSEIDALIESLVDRDAGCGLPRAMLRNDLTHHSNCQCAIYKMLVAEGKLK
jgi:hypothetical protein